MNDDSKVECYKCYGAGEVLRKDDHFGTDMCPKCFGEGKLDWVENARGGKRQHTSHGSFTSLSSGSYHVKPKNYLKTKEYFQRRKSIYKSKKIIMH